VDTRIRSFGKIAIRVSLSLIALYIVLQNIDSQRLLSALVSANLFWLFIALLTYCASKILSSFRLTQYLRTIGVTILESENLRIYFIGMFYNLFLPGGIGGDGYKIWLLQKKFSVSTRMIFQSILFDRLSGMVMLGLLGILFALFAFAPVPYLYLLGAIALIALPLFYFAHRVLAPGLLGVFVSTSSLSICVQGMQVICAWTILMALGIDDFIPAYITVFLLSSLVAVLPISIGGIGIRELVFIYAAGFSPISRDASVAFSLLFFVVTVITSLPGGFIQVPAFKHAEKNEAS
jgi:uncharacterized membrane protein YbhN (UPF0104 family)